VGATGSGVAPAGSGGGATGHAVVRGGAAVEAVADAGGAGSGGRRGTGGSVVAAAGGQRWPRLEASWTWLLTGGGSGQGPPALLDLGHGWLDASGVGGVLRVGDKC
jgi:hypothetical protein